MADVHVCDSVLQPDSVSVNSSTFARVQRRLSEFAAFAPTLANLSLGEVEWSLEPFGNDLLLRINLIARKQGWLFDPLAPRPSRPDTLEAEAQQVFDELLRAGVRVVRLAQALEQADEPGKRAKAADDPLARVLIRNSRKLWRVSRSEVAVQIEFPGVSAFDVDDGLSALGGRLVSIGLKQIELDFVFGPAEVDRKERLTVAYDEASFRSSMPPVGTSVHLGARLYRCKLTRRVIGAVLDSIVSGRS